MQDVTNADIPRLIGYASPDPYPRYRQLRDQGPVHEVADGIYFLPRYEDVFSAIRNHEVFSSEDARPDTAGSDAGARVIINLDPPAHSKLRHLVTGPFRPAAIAALEAHLREVTVQLVDEMVVANRQGEADLVEHLSIPLPVVAIAELLGVPTERRRDFRYWSDHAIADLAGVATDPVETKQAQAAMAGYFMQVIEERRREPGDDLISALVAAEEPLSDIELLMFCFTLLVAGNETTANLIGNGALALLEHPEQAEQLWADPELIPSAVEEFLRFDPPAQAVPRRVKSDVEMSGSEIPAGALAYLGLASGNRDDEHFPDGDRFDVTRNPRDHLSFGNGIHFCLGASLARLEGRIAYEELLKRVRNVRLTGEVERHYGQLRGVRRLPITFDEV